MARRAARPAAPTLKMVAAEAGVSASTVSRVYSHPHLLRPDTVERVRKVAEELGYVPHFTARALITGRLSTIGVVVPDIANPFFPPVIRAVQGRAGEVGVGTLLGDTDEDPVNEERVLLALQQRTDGVVLVSSRMPEPRIQAMAVAHPLVLVNRDVELVDRVLIETGLGMRQAVEHLARTGHRRIAYLGGPESSWSDGERAAAVAEAARREGLDLTLLGPHRPEHEEGRRAARAGLAARVTGVLAFDDVLAQGLLAGLVEAGARVPDDVSLVGCDDILAVRTVPPLSTVHGPSAEAGRLAVELLLAKIDGQVLEPQVVRVPAPFLDRATTGPAPS